MNEAFLLFSWLVYFYLHSLLAATSVKAFFIQLFLMRSIVYRISYNLFSIIGLIVLLYLQFIIPSDLLYNTSWITDGISCCMMVPGLMMMIASIRNYDWKSFIGLSEEKGHALVIGGLNKYVRHPLYSCTMLFVLGFFIWQPYYKNLFLLVLMWIYLTVGIIFEEKKLVKIHGAQYKKYQKRVKKMIPFLW